jgi:hypothetical protein
MQTIIFDSAGSGVKVSSLGGSINFISTGFEIPVEAKNITTKVISSIVWNRFNNISVLKKNNIFRISTDSTTYETLTLKDGQYSITDLQTSIDNGLFLLGIPKGTIVFTADFSSNYVSILMPSTYRIDFLDSANSFGKMIGFNSQVLTSISTTFPIISDNEGDLTPLSNIKINCELGQLSLNGKYENILAYYSLTSQPNYQDTYRPFNPSTADSERLKGTKLTNLTMTIMNEKNEELEMHDNWAVTCLIEYYIPSENTDLILKKMDDILKKLV